MNEDKFESLCRKIEKAFNDAYEYQWHKDNLSEYHSAFFSNYDEAEYMTVFYEGYHIPKKIEEKFVDTTSDIGEIDIYLDHLSDEISECTPEQLERLEFEYRLIGDYELHAYLAVDGIYAVIRNEDFDPDVFNCGCLPY